VSILVRRRGIYLAAVVVAAAIAIALYAANRSGRLYIRDTKVTIVLNNVTVPNARAYRSSEQIWLIDMGNGTEWYGYVRDDRYLMLCHSPQRVPLPWSMYMLKEVLPCIGFNGVKAFDPHLLVTSQSIEFDSAEDRGRIKITFTDPL
jgi:hypothetical protein